MSKRGWWQTGTFVAAGLMVSLAVAGPVSSTQTPVQKIEEIENAGEALKQGKVDEALKLLQEAAKKNPTLPPPRLMLARLFMSSNQPQAGRQLLEQAAAENPDHPAVYLTMGSAALTDGRLSDAVLNCQKALELAKANRWTADQRTTFQKDAREGLVTAHEARKEWADARANLSAWMELDPKNGRNRQRMARALFYLDKYDDAYSELQTAVKDDSSLDSPDVTMGRFWMTKGDQASVKKAAEFFEKAAKKDGDNPKVHLAYADFLLTKGDGDGAKIHVDAAEKKDAKNKETRQMKGLVARHFRDYTSAIRIFQDLLNEEPADFFASNQLALILADQSDDASRRKAIQFAEVNARQYPKLAEALSTLGYAYYRTGNTERAAQLIFTVAQGGQMSQDSAYFLALLLYDKKEYDKVREVLKTALDSTGTFFFRKEAQQLLDKLPKDAAPKDAPKDKTKSK